MDWPLAINRNRDALRRIVAALFAMLAAADGRPLSVGFPHKWGEVIDAVGLTSPRLRGEVARAKPVTERGMPRDASAAPFMLPHYIYVAILLILRPAESAVRRLIVIAAHGLSLKPPESRLLPAGLCAFSANGPLKTPAFALFDPLKRFSLDDFDNSAPPHSSFHSGSEAELHALQILPPDQPVNAAQLLGRLRALRSALNDLPRQARRLARWQARRDVLLQRKGPYRPMRMSAMRPGPPPGRRLRALHEVDDVLRECHGLALDRLNEPDTS